MILNYIWIGFFLVAALVAFAKLIFTGDVQVFTSIVDATFSTAKLGFEISLGLTGVLSLWLGIMKIGENSGVIARFARFASPVFSCLFPEIPKNHPVIGGMFMNFSANLLGLDNAATPIGLNVMQQLKELSPTKDTATNSMIMFLVINASGLTLLPITIMMYRAQLGAASPADVFVPILIATSVSTFTAISLVAIRQRINLLTAKLIIPFLIFVLFITVIVFLFVNGDKSVVSHYATMAANMLLVMIICGFIVSGLVKRVNVYESFIEGAKEGFKTAVTIIPYLVAILVAIGVFRASGAMDYFIGFIRFIVRSIGLDSDFVGALPTILMKPLSGSGSRGMMIDAMTTYGADSFVGRLSSIVQGSTDTTFYVVALYFGSVAIKRIRYTLTYSLIADFAGILAAIIIAYLFFA